MQLVGADRLAGGHQLDLAGLVLEVGEVEAAVAALAEDPSGDLHDLAGVGPGGELAELARRSARGRVAVEANRVGLDPALAQPSSFSSRWARVCSWNSRALRRSLAHGQRESCSSAGLIGA